MSTLDLEELALKKFEWTFVDAIAFSFTVAVMVAVGTYSAFSAAASDVAAEIAPIEAARAIPACGSILFTEPFDDAKFEKRGWYDGAAGAIDATEHTADSPASFRCDFEKGKQSCIRGKPARHPIQPTETLYLGFHVKFSSDWIGSGKRYHPHLFNVLTNKDGDWVGPSATHLTVYAEIVGGHPTLAIQDALNVDPKCLMLGSGEVRGCDGNFSAHEFTERRSVAGCNGPGSGSGRIDCYDAGDDWYSQTLWRSPIVTFANGEGPYDQTNWHFVEVYFEMNRIVEGRGIADGKFRWVQNGEVILSSDEVLFRTGLYPGMKFDQLALLPYIGDGSPRKQQMWIDALTVATARPGSCE